jgi:hypothetical protein
MKGLNRSDFPIVSWGQHMTQIDLRTQAWMKDIGLYCGANANDPAKLKEISAYTSEWSKRLKQNFEHVLMEKT